MNRKKLVIFILLALAVIMIVDFKFSSGPFNQFFEAFITESLADVQDMESEFFRGDFSDESVKAERSSSVEFENEENILASISELKIDNNFGSINVNSSAGEELTVEYTIKVHADDKAAAENYLQNLAIEYNIENNEEDRLVINLIDENMQRADSIKALEVEYDINIPENLSLDLANRFGKVAVVNINGDLVINNKWGSTLLHQIGGRSDLDISYGELEIDELNSELNLKTSYTDNSIKNIEDDAFINSSYAFIKLENIESNLNISSRYGGFEIENVKGRLNIESDYTGMSITDTENEIKADVTYGDIRLRNIAKIELKSSYADTTIENINNLDDYNLDISAENAEIRADFELDIKKEGNTETLLQESENADNNIVIKSRFGDIILRNN